MKINKTYMKIRRYYKENWYVIGLLLIGVVAPILWVSLMLFLKSIE